MNALERLLVISPHLDDAVLSCGLALAAQAGATVCTVFTAPPAQNMSTEWDRACGFIDSQEAMHVRRAEDTAALATLAAKPVHLPFCDAQYHSPPVWSALIAALGREVAKAKPKTLLVPLGLFHSDHVLVADACLALISQLRDMTALSYEDVPYRHMPGAVQTRLSVLRQRGFMASSAPAFDATALPRQERFKHAAIGAYSSQLRAFGPEGRARLESGERYWHLCHAHVPEAAAVPFDERHGACVTAPTCPRFLE